MEYYLFYSVVFIMVFLMSRVKGTSYKLRNK